MACTGFGLPKDIAKLLIASKAHLGGKKIKAKMAEYVFGCCDSGIHIFDIEKTWEKMVLAARACAALSHTESIVAVSGKIYGRKPVMKFAEAISCESRTGRFIPGTFTNRNSKKSVEPRMVIVSDPETDSQAILETAYVNCPVIAFCNTNADLSNVDIAIPINNRSPHAIGAAFFILARLINYIKTGEAIERNMKEVELFFYRDQLELEALMAEHNAENAPSYGIEEPQNGGDMAEFGRAVSVDAQFKQDACDWN